MWQSVRPNIVYTFILGSYRYHLPSTRINPKSCADFHFIEKPHTDMKVRVIYNPWLRI